MKRYGLVALVLVVGLSFAAPAQDEGEALGSGDSEVAELQWAAGLRFTPSFIAHNLPFYTDPALLTAVVARGWVNPQIALEAGGWFHMMQDNWSESSNRMLTVGALYKWHDQDWVDLLLVARGVHYATKSISEGYDCVPPPGEPEPKPERDLQRSVPPYEIVNVSRTYASTLGVALEWSPAPEIGINLEFGLIMSNTISENNYPVRPPVPIDPMNAMPVPPPGSETYASNQLGMAVSVGLMYRF